MKLLAVDPGPLESGWLVCETAPFSICDSGVMANDTLLVACATWDYKTLVIEKVEGYGMPVGCEVFETVFWSGRFAQMADHRERRWDRMGRKPIKIRICGTSAAKDANVWTALLDRFGGKAAAIGHARAPGPLHGVKSHARAALALAVAWTEQNDDRACAR